MKQVMLGIDTGTGSARAGLFDLTGSLVSVGKQDIVLHRCPNSIAEHESADIRTAVCLAVKNAMSLER